MGIRKDVAKLGAGWSPDLEWYAKAINKLQPLPFASDFDPLELTPTHALDSERPRLKSLDEPEMRTYL